jgi:hypothetical protein
MISGPLMGAAGEVAGIFPAKNSSILMEPFDVMAA